MFLNLDNSNASLIFRQKCVEVCVCVIKDKKKTKDIVLSKMERKLEFANVDHKCFDDPLPYSVTTTHSVHNQLCQI